MFYSSVKSANLARLLWVDSLVFKLFTPTYILNRMNSKDLNANDKVLV